MADDRPDAPERAGSRLDLRSTRRGFLAVTTATMAVTAGCGDDGPGGGDANVAEPERRDENDSDDESDATNESTEETEELTDDAGDESATESDDAAGESDERASDDGDDESPTEGDESAGDGGDSDDAESDHEGDDDGSGDDEDGGDGSSDGDADDDADDGNADDGDADDGDADDDDADEDEPGTDDASEDDGEDEGDRESEDDGNADTDEEGEDESGDEESEDDEDDEPPFEHPSATNMDHSPILGPDPEDAPATILMYDDPSCPACAYFEAEIFPDLEPYVDAGDLSVVWRGIPVIEDWAEGALQAMWATYERDVDAFWALRDHLFAIQDSIASGEEAIDEAVSYLEAETAVDADGVRADAEGGRFTDRLANDEDAAARAGLDATPYFFLFRDGEFRTEIRGAQDARVFTSTLEL
ncbi:DsbA family protein [Natrononativus amylolyticus]|uniref:DsbA family protein n=1 Tax=Natrononativus amylolyticus TaxID=2963434 RepID=UPI0020CBC913|nr:DsbA family protein [Natrononativus amylolyticus]